MSTSWCGGKGFMLVWHIMHCVKQNIDTRKRDRRTSSNLPNLSAVNNVTPIYGTSSNGRNNRHVGNITPLGSVTRALPMYILPEMLIIHDTLCLAAADAAGWPADGDNTSIKLTVQCKSTRQPAAVAAAEKECISHHRTKPAKHEWIFISPAAIVRSEGWCFCCDNNATFSAARVICSAISTSGCVHTNCRYR